LLERRGFETAVRFESISGSSSFALAAQRNW
jgi:hypothetical protein